MAFVSFKKGLLANLPTTYTEGAFYVTTDERAMYLDVDSSTRVRIGDFQEFATVEALQANQNPSTTALYYISSLNVLAKWNGTQYVQINLDTGATSVEVVGDGNAVTSASYDPATRKLTLTRGGTFATKAEIDALDAYVGDIPEGYTESNIVAYVNKKAEETLNAASGGSSESAASVLAALNTYKAENDPKVTALEAKAHEHANQAELDLIATGDKAKWDAAAAANAAAAKAADDKAVAAQTDVDALEAKVGTVPEGKTVVEMISDAQSAAEYDDTALKARVAANEAAVSVLNGDATTVGSVKKQVADAVAQIVADAPEAYDTLKEISDWISSHANDASAMNSQIATNKTDIAALKALVGALPESAEATTIVEYVDEVVAALAIGDYAKAADLAAAVTRIAALEGKAHEHANKDVIDGVTAAKVAAWDAAEQNAKNYADSLADNYDAAGDAAQALIDAKSYADGLAGNYDAAGNAATALSDAKAYTDTALTWGSF